MHHSSYHLPLVGAGHRAYDALEEGNYLGAAGHAGLFGAEAFGLRSVGRLRGAGKVWWGGKLIQRNKAFLKPVKNAYQLAKEGKIHGELYPKNVNKPANELIRSVRSMQKQIVKHRDKIANPKKYRSGWDTFSEERKHNVLEHFHVHEELKGFIEQRDIFQGILDNRKA